jgi:hypothetical protein
VALATFAMIGTGVIAPLLALWNRPQRYRRSYTNYAYTSPSRKQTAEPLMSIDDPVVVSMPQPSHRRRIRDDRLEEDVAALCRRRAG